MSNDAENAALITAINYTVQNIHRENCYLNCILQYYFYCTFDQINAAVTQTLKHLTDSSI